MVVRMSLVTRSSDKHHEVVRMLVLGFSVQEIAQAVGLDTVQVLNIKRSPLIQSKLKAMREIRDQQTLNVADKLQRDMVKNLEVLAAIRDGEATDREGNPVFADLKLRAEIAFGLMDRAGYSPVKKVQGEFVHSTIQAGELEEIKNRAREARSQAVVAEMVSVE